MSLLVDLGNSRLKWAVTDGTTWESDAVLINEQDIATQLTACWSALPPPEKVVIASVASATRLQAVSAWIQGRWSVAPRVVQPQRQQLGVTNAYHDVASLGSDRWAALIAARHLTRKPVCLVDCGTAVTVDALSADGEFLGGVIFPGLRLLRRSLVTETAGILAVDGDPESYPGRTTADGVAAGTAVGLCGAIERIVGDYRRMLGEAMEVMITGGDAARLLPQLSLTVTHVPDLVLRGLARIAEQSP